MSTIVLSSMAVVANVTGAAMVLPQMLRLRRHGRVEGVSPTWIGVGIALNAGWLAYAAGAGVWPLAPVVGTGVVLYGLIARQYRRIVGPASVPPMVVGFVAAGTGPLLAVAIGGWSAAGVVMGLSYAVQFTPAVAGVMRTTDTEGVAASTWIMAWIEAVAWFVYGVVIADDALLIGGAGGAVMSTVILARLTQLRAAGPSAVAHAISSAPRA